MGVRRTTGFTIIETMLVLAITAALVAGVFIGVGTSINNQRYRDAAESFKLLLQDQYAKLSSVQNDRDNTWSCDAAAQTAQTSPIDRGQSDCLLLGRLMTINEGETALYTIVGREVGAPVDASDDLIDLNTNYSLAPSTVLVENGELEWGTAIAWPTTGTGAQSPTTPRSASILFIRSPSSGQIYTFVQDGIPPAMTSANIKNMIVGGTATPNTGQSDVLFCIDPQGLFIGGGYSVYIDSYAAVPNAIETRTNELLNGMGETTRC